MAIDTIFYGLVHFKSELRARMSRYASLHCLLRENAGIIKFNARSVNQMSGLLTVSGIRLAKVAQLLAAFSIMFISPVLFAQEASAPITGGGSGENISVVYAKAGNQIGRHNVNEDETATPSLVIFKDYLYVTKIEDRNGNSFDIEYKFTWSSNGVYNDPVFTIEKVRQNSTEVS